MGRSIWDMPATAVAAPPTLNHALTREQQEHQLLHQQQQQQFLLQQQQIEAGKSSNQGWGNVRTSVQDELPYQNTHHGHAWPSQDEQLRDIHKGSSQIPQEFDNTPPENVQHQDFLAKNNKDCTLSSTNSFRQETSNDNDNIMDKNNFINSNNNSVSKTKDSKKEKKEKIKKETKKSEKISLNTFNQQELHASETYIPGMEGAVKPDMPITATKSMEEEQQRAQADALYRLQVVWIILLDLSNTDSYSFFLYFISVFLMFQFFCLRLNNSKC